MYAYKHTLVDESILYLDHLLKSEIGITEEYNYFSRYHQMLPI